MGTPREPWSTPHSRSRLLQLLRPGVNNKGQQLVEFSLVFVFLLVIAWIPADFGIAFYTGQLALNASREGARIGAVTNPFNIDDVKTETCKRLPRALLVDAATNCAPYARAKVTVTPPAGTACNQQLSVTVEGKYNFFFYRFLNLMGVSVDPGVDIKHTTKVRWEHQDTCA